MANQPKAAGSSLILQLTRHLITSALHELHYDFVKDTLPLPLATGMAISLTLLTLAEIQPTKKLIIWSRIDQKTCLKAVLTANL
jgi:O-phospho-L-seryl-tRNASec:L-selenocysteinyl-tRNA synthase